MDWLSPEFRWEHRPEEAAIWFTKRKYTDVKLTTKDIFGYSMIGTNPV